MKRNVVIIMKISVEKVFSNYSTESNMPFAYR